MMRTNVKHIEITSWFGYMRAWFPLTIDQEVDFQISIQFENDLNTGGHGFL